MRSFPTCLKADPQNDLQKQRVDAPRLERPRNSNLPSGVKLSVEKTRLHMPLCLASAQASRPSSSLCGQTLVNRRSDSSTAVSVRSGLAAFRVLHKVPNEARLGFSALFPLVRLTRSNYRASVMTPVQRRLPLREPHQDDRSRCPRRRQSPRVVP